MWLCNLCPKTIGIHGIGSVAESEPSSILSLSYLKKKKNEDNWPCTLLVAVRGFVSVQIIFWSYVCKNLRVLGVESWPTCEAAELSFGNQKRDNSGV